MSCVEAETPVAPLGEQRLDQAWSAGNDFLVQQAPGAVRAHYAVEKMLISVDTKDTRSKTGAHSRHLSNLLANGDGPR